jgi:hypothetical protein
MGFQEKLFGVLAAHDALTAEDAAILNEKRCRNHITEDLAASEYLHAPCGGNIALHRTSNRHVLGGD